MQTFIRISQEIHSKKKLSILALNQITKGKLFIKIMICRNIIKNVSMFWKPYLTKLVNAIPPLVNQKLDFVMVFVSHTLEKSNCS